MVFCESKSSRLLLRAAILLADCRGSSVKSDAESPSFLLCFFVNIAAFAALQAQLPQFKHYTVDDGLPSSETHDLLQDRDGFVWIATDRGVCRYDGYRFRIYTKLDGLCGNFAFTMHQDLQRRLWFATMTGCLSYRLNNRFFSFAQGERDGAPPVFPSASLLYVDALDTIWLDGTSARSYRISPEGQMLRAFADYDARPATLMIKHWEDGSYVIELLPAKDAAQRFDQVHVFSEGAKAVLPFAFHFEDQWDFTMDFRRLPDNQYLLRLGHTSAVLDTTGVSHTWQSHHAAMSHSSLLDRDGDLWLGLRDNGGVRFLPQADFSRQPIGYLQGLSVSDIMQDHEGGIWFSTLEDGLYYLHAKTTRSFRKEDGLYGEQVRCIAPGSDCVWVSTDEGGLHRFRPSGDSLSFDVWIGYPGIRALTETADGALWLSTSDGTSRLDPTHDAKPRLVSNDPPIQFRELNDNSLIFCSANELVRVKDDSLHRRRLAFLSEDYQKIVFPLSTDDILIGAYDGLYSYNWRSGRFRTPADEHPALRNRISDIARDSDGRLYFATTGIGLIIVEGDSTRVIGRQNGLSSNMCHALALDGASLWLATNAGLNKIDGERISSFTQLDGLASNEIHDLALFGDRLWLATHKGLTLMPGEIRAHALSPPPLHLTGLRINDRDTTIRSSYRLSHRQNNLTIHYVGLSYLRSGTLRYRYRLLGLDSAWQLTGNTSVLFPGLHPGAYTFQLAAGFGGGDWTADSRELQIVIAPAFWQTWWFRSALGLVLLAGLWAIVRMRFAMLRKTFALQRQSLEAEQTALRAQLNPHFLFNSLNSIQTLIARNERTFALRIVAKFARLMRGVLRSSQESFVSLERELESLRLYLDLESLRFDNSFSYEIDVATDIDVTSVSIPPMLIQPYLENAVWHGIMKKNKAGGHISLVLRRRESLLHCRVEDNGAGRRRLRHTSSKGEQGPSGMKMTAARLRNLAEMYQCRCGVEVMDLVDDSGAPAGTRIDLRLPLRNIAPTSHLQPSEDYAS